MTVGGLSFIVRAVDALTHLLAAALFGAGDEMDALVIALLAPVFLVTVFSGAFHASVIPAYISIKKKQGDRAAHRFFSGVLALSLVFIAVLALVLALSAPRILPVLGAGFNPAKLALTASLFYMAIPILLFGGLARMWCALLNATERFTLAAISPVVKSVVLVGFLLTMGGSRSHGGWGIYAFGWGMACGAFVEMAVLGYFLKCQKFPVRPRWHGMNDDLKQVIKQFTPMAAGAILMGGAELIDHSMAAMLDAGSVSALSYANKMIMFVLVISSGALGTAVFPYFSLMAANRDRKLMIETLKTYSCLIILFSLPATGLLFYFAEPLVRLLFERGAFTQSDTHQIAAVLAIYGFQITFYLLSILEVRLISALQDNHILMVSAMISLPLNITLNYLFMRYMGVAGIALSTVLVYFSAFVFLTFMLAKRMKALPQ